MSLTHCLKAKDETEQTHLEVKVISGQADCFLFCFVLGNQGHAIRSLPTHLLKRNTKQLWNFQQICLLPYLPLLFFFLSVMILMEMGASQRNRQIAPGWKEVRMLDVCWFLSSMCGNTDVSRERTLSRGVQPRPRSPILSKRQRIQGLSLGRENGFHGQGKGRCTASLLPSPLWQVWEAMKARNTEWLELCFY